MKVCADAKQSPVTSPRGKGGAPGTSSPLTHPTLTPGPRRRPGESQRCGIAWRQRKGRTECLAVRQDQAWCCRCLRHLGNNQTNTCRGPSQPWQVKCDHWAGEVHACVADPAPPQWQLAVRGAAGRLLTHPTSQARELALRTALRSWEAAVAATGMAPFWEISFVRSYYRYKPCRWDTQ